MSDNLIYELGPDAQQPESDPRIPAALRPRNVRQYVGDDGKAVFVRALEMVLDDAVNRGVVEFEATDSHDLKVQYAYRLLVHDKAISPIPNEQISMPSIKHRLAMWVTHQLPKDHELLK